MSIKNIILLMSTLLIAGCGTIVNRTEEAPTLPVLSYANPPRPTFVLPSEPKFLSYSIVEKRVAEGSISKPELMCTTVSDVTELGAREKEVSLWMNTASAALDYHEEQNARIKKLQLELIEQSKKKQ